MAGVQTVLTARQVRDVVEADGAIAAAAAALAIRRLRTGSNWNH
jgi:hypothetical protein